MLLFTTREKLELQSVRVQKSSQIVFRNKILTRGPDFAIKLWQTAKQYCQIYYHSDSLCILVDRSFYVSVWKEYDRTLQVKSKQKQESAPEPEQPIQIKLNSELLWCLPTRISRIHRADRFSDMYPRFGRKSRVGS